MEGVDKIKKIQVSILSPEEILNGSACEVLTQMTYENNIPVVNGLFDARMGTIERNQICATCKQDNRNCTGHPGHIVCARPVYHVHFFATILKLLRCVCIRCSKLLVNFEDPEFKAIMNNKKAKNRFLQICQYCQKSKYSKVCRADDKNNGCGMTQPNKYIKENIFKIFAEFPLGDTTTLKYLSPENVLNILRNITDDNCKILGFHPKFSRPEWMICTVLPVPPPHVRPSVRQEGSQKREDDLTHKLADIVKTNNILKEKLKDEDNVDSEKNAKIIDEWTQLLQYHVATFIDNELPGLQPAQQRSGRPLKSLRQRLQAKEGRLRGNLMGKRCDFTGRSVISPDANINIDELGVPLEIAMNLTYPEVVTSENYNRMRTLIVNGPDVYPGAKSVKKANTDITISLSVRDGKTLNLELGDVVNRHLLDGDVVLFNRQPSLHRMSMMGHRVKVLEKGLSFRLNVSVTSPYNADFDGDEMNIHVPQSKMATYEIQNIALVPTQIISPQKNGPVIGIVQDALTGLYRFTTFEAKFDRMGTMRLMYQIDMPKLNIPRPIVKNTWTAHNIISSFLPPISYRNDSVVIRNGNFEKGTLDKNSIGKGATGGINHIIWKDFNPTLCRDNLYNMQKIANQYLLMSGFSVGMADTIASEKTREQIQEIIVESKEKVKYLIKKLQSGTYTTQTDKSIADDFEFQVNQILGQARDKAGSIAKKNLTADNRLVSMANSGAKGDFVNIAQMMACLGQQNVENKRIPNGLFKRSLPHFFKDDSGPEAHGFVENSFNKGLTPYEFFFHAMGGRIGLIDTAVKTSEVGYIQRKLIKSMEDTNVKYDGSVRTASGTIVQFLYGEDGFDATRIEKMSTQFAVMGDIQFEDVYCMSETDVKNINKLVASSARSIDVNAALPIELFGVQCENIDDVAAAEKKNLIQIRKQMQEYISKNFAGAVYSPVQIYRYIQYAQTNVPSFGVDIGPAEILQMTSGLYNKFLDIHLGKTKSKVADEFYKNALFNLSVVIFTTLSCKQIYCHYKLNRAQLEYVCTKVMEQFVAAIVNPGEMVGIIASQSIGEVVTQMTLNTFHFSGISSKSQTTTGVPRLKELLNVSKSINTPENTVYLREPFSSSFEKTKEIQQAIQYTVLFDLINSTKVVYTKGKQMEPLMNSYNLYSQYLKEDCSSPWCIVININREIMFNKNLNMYKIYRKIKENSSVATCLYTDDNASQLMLRVYVKTDDLNEEDVVVSVRQVEKQLLGTVIQGVQNITNAYTHKIDTIARDSNGEYKSNGRQEYILYTQGTNLAKLLMQPEVDPHRTISNDVVEVCEVLGIEAARTMLSMELENTINGTAYINYRHISLLADVMTNSGELISIDRHGVKKSDIGPLARASFEETVEQLMKSAVFAENDKVRGVSSNIMLGQVAPAGTGEFNVLFDETKLFTQKPIAAKKAEKSSDSGSVVSSLSKVSASTKSTSTTKSSTESALKDKEYESVQYSNPTCNAQHHFDFGMNLSQSTVPAEKPVVIRKKAKLQII